VLLGKCAATWLKGAMTSQGTSHSLLATPTTAMASQFYRYDPSSSSATHTHYVSSFQSTRIRDTTTSRWAGCRSSHKRPRTTHLRIHLLRFQRFRGTCVKRVDLNRHHDGVMHTSFPACCRSIRAPRIWEYLFSHREPDCGTCLSGLA
jgi:hypothetical protein